VCYPHSNPLTTSPDSPKPKPTLEALPYDIQHTLMKYLDPASSASLALACPAIYPVHRSTKGSVPLKTTADTNRISKCKGGAPLLCEMLRSWMGKDGVRLKFSWYNERFVTAERWEELEEARWCDGWESS